MTEKTFNATDASLADATAFMEEELERADCPMKVVMQASVCLEEMFVNVAHYAYPGGTGTVTVGISTEGGKAVLVLTDSGIPFDPLAKADPDITLSAEERKIGGLGILMVKKTMDEVSYERRDGKNIFTMAKRFGGSV